MYSMAENIPVPWLGIKPGLPRYKTNVLTTDPKSWLSDTVVEIDYILEAMRHLLYVDI